MLPGTVGRAVRPSFRVEHAPPRLSGWSAVRNQKERGLGTLRPHPACRGGAGFVTRGASAETSSPPPRLSGWSGGS